MLQQTASAPTSGRYRLMERLGGGSTGEVYRAYDRLTGQYIALKRVSTSTKAPGWEETVDRRFAIAREFEMLASLRHPNIIGVLDYGFDLSDDKHPYFIMTLLEEPETLLEAARGQPTAVQVDLLLQLLQALAYVHRRGILHRDLKPGNVLVEKGVVKLLDFGLALSSDETPHAEVGGTLAYIAPEVLSGQAPSVVSDLYAVGVMAYEMFAGQHPFLMEDTTEFINNLLYTPVDTGLLLIDERLRPLLGGLLAKKAEERPPSALAAMAALCAATHIPLPQETVAIRESFLQAARFVGRERELAQLNAALESILQGGSGGIWLVTGESGVGKSRLLDEVRTRALVKGALVLRGDAYDGAGALDQVGRDIIRRLAVSASISPENASVLKQLVPDLGALMGSGTPLDIPDAPPLEREAARQRMYTAIANSFYTLEQPVLILVEDVHWARGISDILRLMQNVTRQRPVLIIAAYRDEEAPELAQQIPGAHFLRLERLPEAAIGELSRSMLGAIGQQPHVVDLLQRETEGNAFFLVEVVRALAEDAGRLDDIGTRTLPETVFAGGVRRIVERRLQRVPEARPLLERAAVAGRYLDMNLMQALAAHLGTAPYATLDDWLNDCANAAVLDLQDCCRWRFSHDKLREGLLETLRTPLPQLHAEVAAAFEAAYPEASEYAALLAEHWRAAGDSEKEGYYAAVGGGRAL
ncbi:MAG: protein kinase, partial [Chloroflexi bacterium]|nr:protein kinase [Chloroflexota bacterium]